MLPKNCKIVGGPETLLEITGTIFIGTFDAHSNHWDGIENEESEVNVHFSEIQLKFNYQDQNYLGNAYDEEEIKIIDDIVGTSKKTEEVHMYSLFTIDSYNKTSLVLHDCRIDIMTESFSGSLSQSKLVRPKFKT